MPLLSLLTGGLLGGEKSCRLAFDATGDLAAAYRSFRRFQELNHAVMADMARLQTRQAMGEGAEPIGRVLRRFRAGLGELAGALEELTPRQTVRLRERLAAIDREISAAWRQDAAAVESDPLVIDFDRLSREDVRRVGGKAAHLALAARLAGVEAPDGFALTTRGLAQVLDETPGLRERLDARMESVSLDDAAGLERASAEMVQAVMAARLPEALAREVAAGCGRLAARRGVAVERLRLAARSSAVGEDGESSFAGQFESILNVSAAELPDAILKTLASAYSPRAISYRLRLGLEVSDAPMAVAVVEMIAPEAAGVLYTADPVDSSSRDGRRVWTLAAVRGLGDVLVSGRAQPDEWRLDPATGQALDYRPGRPERTGDKQSSPVLDEPERAAVWALGRAVERISGPDMGWREGIPLDMEWAVSGGTACLLQVRPLHLEARTDAGQDGPPDEDLAAELPSRAILATGGTAASSGMAAGRLYVLAEGRRLADAWPGAILVAPSAAPELAGGLGALRGVIAAVGSVAGHLASVARELRIPALFNLPDALSLPHGAPATLWADRGLVLEGCALPFDSRLGMSGRAPSDDGARSEAAASPIAGRFAAVMALVAPLNLTDPRAPGFAPEGCRTAHDVIRYAHETAMRAMFGLAGGLESSSRPTVVLRTRLPLRVVCADLGGGFRPGLTTCDRPTIEDVRSLPMRVLWRGFSHPGVSWAGSVAFSAGTFLELAAASATAELGPDRPGGDSFALLAAEYVNFNAKFGYHYSDIEAHCGPVAEENRVRLHFGGGAGGLVGKGLRVLFLSRVLERLGFLVTPEGDALEASLSGLTRKDTEAVLDQLGRLLACSRLMDMAIADVSRVSGLVEHFMAGNYDFLGADETPFLPGYWTHVGVWRREAGESGDGHVVHDGADPGGGARAATALARAARRMLGAGAEAWLAARLTPDRRPLAISRQPEAGDGRFSLRMAIDPASGPAYPAGGLAFGVRDAGRYYALGLEKGRDGGLRAVLRLVSEDGAQELASAPAPSASPSSTDSERTLEVVVQGRRMTCHVDGREVFSAEGVLPVEGRLGLWAGTDAVVRFGDPVVLETKSSGMNSAYSNDPSS